ncbi:hypothetical protein JKF63_07872 [Porcisia hertigi]|uniref:Uncharacterized protein n=1 Tax=Porcisia hertigi TaxID=2761500 RepID=A0A836LJP5_9TRYP|nr:hypothetical protein JKF63_07872 [Porcisia hertigi]
MTQLTRDEIHIYAKAMIDAVQTPAFQARVRASISRAPIPTDAEAVMTRYEEVQADYFSNHYKAADGVYRSPSTSGNGGSPPDTYDAPKLDGVYIVEQLKQAVNVYRDAETERLITRLCLLIEGQVECLLATEPALKPLSSGSQHGAKVPPQSGGGGGGGGSGIHPFMNPSSQMKQVMDMAMRTLNPKQREVFERVQQSMASGSPPSPEDMRDMFLIRRQLGAFMQTMQKFGQMPGNGGGGEPNPK